MPSGQNVHEQVANISVAFDQLDLLLSVSLSCSDFRHSNDDGAIRRTVGTSLDLHCGSSGWLCLHAFLLPETPYVRDNDEPA